MAADVDRLALGFALAALVALGACGGGSGPTQPRAVVTPTPSPTPSPTPAPTPSPTPPANVSGEYTFVLYVEDTAACCHFRLFEAAVAAHTRGDYVELLSEQDPGITIAVRAVSGDGDVHVNAVLDEARISPPFRSPDGLRLRYLYGAFGAVGGLSQDRRGVFPATESCGYLEVDEGPSSDPGSGCACNNGFRYCDPSEAFRLALYPR